MVCRIVERFLQWGRGPVEYSRPTVVWPLRPEARVVWAGFVRQGPKGSGDLQAICQPGRAGEGAAAGGAGGGAPVVWDFSAGEKREREREREKRRVVGGAAASVGAPLSPDCTRRALSGVPAVGAAA